jgi:hypothetical protein
MPQAIRHLRSGCFSPQTTTATTHHLHFFPFLLLLTLSPSQNEIASCTPLSAPSRALSPGLQSASLFSSSQVMGGKTQSDQRAGDVTSAVWIWAFFPFPRNQSNGPESYCLHCHGRGQLQYPDHLPCGSGGFLHARARWLLFFFSSAFLTCPMLVKPFLPQSILGPAAERRSRRRGGKTTDGALTTGKSTRQIAP